VKVKGLRIAAYLGGVAALSGCVVQHLDYPSSWAQIEKPSVGACPRLAGRFDNESEEGRRLSRLLGQGGTAAVHVAVVQPAEGALEVLLYQSPATPEPAVRTLLSRERGDFDCQSGMLVLKTTGHSSRDGAAVSVETMTISLAMNGDGFLVAEARQGGVGLLLFFVPVGGSFVEWFRFRPASTEAKPEPQPEPVRRQSEPVLGL